MENLHLDAESLNSLHLCPGKGIQKAELWPRLQLWKLLCREVWISSALKFSINFALSNLSRGCFKQNKTPLNFGELQNQAPTGTEIRVASIILIYDLKAMGDTFKIIESLKVRLQNFWMAAPLKSGIEDLQGFGYGRIDAGVKWVLLMSLWWVQYELPEWDQNLFRHFTDPTGFPPASPGS